MGFVDHDDTVMNKFNESVQIEETDLYKEGEMKMLINKRNRPGMEDGPKRRTRNYPTNHVSHANIGDVTNHTDGTVSFQLDTIPEKGTRTIDVFQGERRLFSLSVGQQGVCYQILQQGHDSGCFTLWEDEV